MVTRLLSRCLRWVGRVLTRPFRRKPKRTGEVFSDERLCAYLEWRSCEPHPYWQKRPEGKQ